MSKSKLQTLKGFRDFLPEEKRARDFVERKFIETFELYGFSPLETPTLEYAELLMGKYGEEADKLVYSFTDKGERSVALRYDQTVPTTRILSQYKNDLPKFFRRYQIQNVFRAEKPQKGRYRELKQCDIDIFGSDSPLADAEILACTYAAFKNVGFKSVELRINDRQVLFKTLNNFKTKDVDTFSIIQSIDKLDKKTVAEVRKELEDKGLSAKDAENAIKSVEDIKMSDNLKAIFNFAQQLGVPDTSLVFFPTLARGLDYYTGIIFEIVLPEYPYGSCGGGGRYDNLVEQLGGPKIPAVGVAFGFDRTVEAALESKLLKNEKKISTLITIFDESHLKNALDIASYLRNAQKQCEVYPNSKDALSKQFKYASDNGFDYAIVIGPDEILNEKVVLKDLKAKTQEAVDKRVLLTKIR